MAAGRGLLAAEHTLHWCLIMIRAASAADWLLPAGSRNALNQPVSGAHAMDRSPGAAHHNPARRGT